MRVCDLVQVPVIGPSLAVGVPTEQLSVAMAEPSADSICAAVGLHPNELLLPVAVITGGILSVVTVKVFVQLCVCPQVDVTVYVIVTLPPQLPGAVKPLRLVTVVPHPPV